jgi:hypothetical protein
VLCLKKPLPQAKKALKRFPSIGDPGAEKILLLTRSYPVMALYSNGLRTLCRVGLPRSRRIIQRHTVWFRMRYMGNSLETAIR